MVGRTDEKADLFSTVRLEKLNGMHPEDGKRSQASSGKTKSQAEIQGWGKYMDEQVDILFQHRDGATQWVPPSGWIDDEALSMPSSDELTSSSSSTTKSKEQDGINM